MAEKSSQFENLLNQSGITVPARQELPPILDQLSEQPQQRLFQIRYKNPPPTRLAGKKTQSLFAKELQVFGCHSSSLRQSYGRTWISA